MTYDEFATKLMEIKSEFKKVKGTDLASVQELEAFLHMKLIRKKSTGLKSLKGLKL